MVPVVSLVADLGESFGPYTMGDDAALLELVTCANIACGFHAGDPRVMDATVRRCAQRGVEVGAHPSFPDLVGFGRRAMELSAEEVRTDVLYQIGALSAFARAHGTRVTHVVPHGKLGNLVGERADYAGALADAITAFDPSLVLGVTAGVMQDLAEQRGLATAVVGAVDRAYTDAGTLVPRSQPGAVLDDVDQIVQRTVRMVVDGTVESISGRPVPVEVDAVLLHGDGPHALDAAAKIRSALAEAGVQLVGMSEVVRAEGGRA
ncbi:LamB/YcsF family protein [Kineococcus sp. G2]|uniref:LamB/YcsF family protein n=1 Tax=Kineococcus sp. G2 TaxID=3127484 RepID=UPI00301BB23E